MVIKDINHLHHINHLMQRTRTHHLLQRIFHHLSWERYRGILVCVQVVETSIQSTQIHLMTCASDIKSGESILLQDHKFRNLVLETLTITLVFSVYECVVRNLSPCFWRFLRKFLQSFYALIRTVWRLNFSLICLCIDHLETEFFINNYYFSLH